MTHLYVRQESFIFVTRLIPMANMGLKIATSSRMSGTWFVDKGHDSLIGVGRDCHWLMTCAYNGALAPILSRKARTALLYAAVFFCHVSLCLYVCACACVTVRACVCVRERECDLVCVWESVVATYYLAYRCVCVYVWMRACACARVCERARARQKVRE